VFDVVLTDTAHDVERECCHVLGTPDLRTYFRRPSGFFESHKKRYSQKRGRKAPIYWPLSTASGSYTLWLYYHRLTDQTLYAAVNKYLDPKLGEVEGSIAQIEADLRISSGQEATRLRDRLNASRLFAGELRELRDELLRIAALPYRPNLNDGVIVNAAPLNRLFRLRSWAKDTRNVWTKLESGAYDWSHLAYTLWPERVKETCKRDRSVAIAHGFEELYEDDLVKKGRGKAKSRTTGAVPR
jgi:hypothetical protein